MKTGEALIKNESKNFIKIKYEPNAEKVPTHEMGRFVPILPNMVMSSCEENYFVVDNGGNKNCTDQIFGLNDDLKAVSPMNSAENNESLSDEITFDVTAEQEADIKSEPMQDPDLDADDVSTSSLIEVKTENDDDEAPSITPERAPETMITSKMITIPMMSSEKKVTVYNSGKGLGKVTKSFLNSILRFKV